ncbi:MAG TPA: hypothetical protein VJN18_11510 [Polyangiaceae bacterium]|nr:hypothetical protein [Polyangiaceae bacterium]
MSHRARPVVPTQPARLHSTRHVRRVDAPTAPAGEALADPTRTPEAFLRLFASPVLCVPAGQMMPLWLALVEAMDPAKGLRGLVVASEDVGAYEAAGVTLANRYYGDGQPALFLCASASPALKVLPALWAAQWRNPFVLVTGECASTAGPGTVQDSRGVYGPSLVELTAPLTQATTGESGSLHLTDPDSAWQALKSAPGLVIERRKAVHLNLPVDVQAALFGARK